MRKITAILFLATSIAANCFAQTASIKVVRKFYDNSFEKFDSIRFQFNDTKIAASDTLARKVTLNRGLDQCVAIIGKDTLRFLTRFKANHEYMILPGCCCTAFTLEAINNSRRGTVTYKNATKRNLGLVVAEANIAIAKPDSTAFLFSHESAMCLFKPCSILLTDTSYLSEVYDYKPGKRDYDKLWKEQEQYILAQEWFHFLHGEKIELLYNDKNKALKIKLMGYLTDKEYQDASTFLNND